MSIGGFSDPNINQQQPDVGQAHTPVKKESVKELVRQFEGTEIKKPEKELNTQEKTNEFGTEKLLKESAQDTVENQPPRRELRRSKRLSSEEFKEIGSKALMNLGIHRRVQKESDASKPEEVPKPVTSTHASETADQTDAQIVDRQMNANHLEGPEVALKEKEHNRSISIGARNIAPPLKNPLREIGGRGPSYSLPSSPASRPPPSRPPPSRPPPPSPPYANQPQMPTLPGLPTLPYGPPLRPVPGQPLPQQYMHLANQPTTSLQGQTMSASLPPLPPPPTSTPPQPKPLPRRPSVEAPVTTSTSLTQSAPITTTAAQSQTSALPSNDPTGAKSGIKAEKTEKKEEPPKTIAQLQVEKNNIMNIISGNVLGKDEDGEELKIDFRDFAITYRAYLTTGDLSTVLDNIFNEASQDKDKATMLKCAEFVDKLIDSGLSPDEAKKLTFLQNNKFVEFVKNENTTNKTNMKYELAVQIASPQVASSQVVSPQAKVPKLSDIIPDAKIGSKEWKTAVNNMSTNCRLMLAHQFSKVTLHDVILYNKEKGKNVNCSNLIDCTTKLSEGVLDVVFSSTNKNEFQERVKFFIDVAESSFSQNDFTTANAILASLQQLDSRSGKLLDKEINNEIAVLNDKAGVLGGNKSNMRKKSMETKQTIPLAVILFTDSTGILEGSKKLIGKNEKCFNPDIASILLKQNGILKNAEFGEQIKTLSEQNKTPNTNFSELINSVTIPSQDAKNLKQTECNILINLAEAKDSPRRASKAKEMKKQMGAEAAKGKTEAKAKPKT